MHRQVKLAEDLASSSSSSSPLAVCHHIHFVNFSQVLGRKLEVAYISFIRDPVGEAAFIISSTL